MEIKDRVKKLRKSTGINRKEFYKYFGIPYRTVTEWERGTRKMPDYVFRMMEYQIRMEKIWCSNTQEDKECVDGECISIV